MNPNTRSIFKDGKLKPGIYKIQNLFSETYLDIHRHSREVCCRSTRDLGDGRGLWEIKSLGGGYTVRMIEPGRPEQFCAPMEGLNGGNPLCVTAYPVAWRVEVAKDGIYQGFEYVRFHWGLTKKTWDLVGDHRASGTKVEFHDVSPSAWQTWMLILVEVEEVPPVYNAAGEPPIRIQHAELERDEFGTIVNEVTVLTSTVTTHKRYRVEDA